MESRWMLYCDSGLYPMSYLHFSVISVLLVIYIYMHICMHIFPLSIAILSIPLSKYSILLVHFNTLQNNGIHFSWFGNPAYALVILNVTFNEKTQMYFVFRTTKLSIAQVRPVVAVVHSCSKELNGWILIGDNQERYIDNFISNIVILFNQEMPYFTICHSIGPCWVKG